MSEAIVNGAFRNQRVTGQQRYASEIADRLIRSPGVREKRVPSGWGAVRTWAWAQGLAFTRPKGALLVTLTARGPFWSQRQILVVHDLFVLDHPEWFSKTYIATHVPVLRAQLASAAAYIAVSAPVAKQVEERFARGRPVVVAPNAPSDVFNEVDPAVTDIVLARYQLIRNRYLLVVGTADPRKNLKTLWSANGLLPEEVRSGFPLVWAGGSSRHHSAAERVPPDVQSLGYVPDQVLASLYSGARAVLFPSLAEGFGLPLVEAHAAGAQVIASDLEVFRWVAGDGALYVPPLDVEGWASAIQSVVLNPPTSLSAWPADEFSWDRSAEVVLALVRRRSSPDRVPGHPKPGAPRPGLARR